MATLIWYSEEGEVIHFRELEVSSNFAGFIHNGQRPNEWRLTRHDLAKLSHLEAHVLNRTITRMQLAIGVDFEAIKKEMENGTKKET